MCAGKIYIAGQFFTALVLLGTQYCAPTRYETCDRSAASSAARCFNRCFTRCFIRCLSLLHSLLIPAAFRCCLRAHVRPCSLHVLEREEEGTEEFDDDRAVGSRADAGEEGGDDQVG